MEELFNTVLLVRLVGVVRFLHLLGHSLHTFVEVVHIRSTGSGLSTFLSQLVELVFGLLLIFVILIVLVFVFVFVFVFVLVLGFFLWGVLLGLFLSVFRFGYFNSLGLYALVGSEK